jgi:hypothetical protein
MPVHKNNPRSKARIDKQRIKETRITVGEEDVTSNNIGSPKYICNRCSGPLDKVSDDEWHCDQCLITTIPSVEDVRIEQDIEIPRGPNTETLISCPDYSNSLTKDVQIRHTIEPRGILAKFKEKGMKITNYSETDGAGRPITNRRRYDDDDE